MLNTTGETKCEMKLYTRIEKSEKGKLVYTEAKRK
jgi:hypothetical protein